MPYLVESVLTAVRRAGAEVRRVIHPIVVVERTPDGELRHVLPDADPAAPPPGALAESWIHLDLVGAAPAGLEDDLAEVLREVREVVQDAPAMARQAIGLADRLLADELSVPTARRALRPLGDVANLLRWLADGHFTFLGHRYLTAARGRLVAEGPGLGVLRTLAAPSRRSPRRSRRPRRRRPPICSCSPGPARRAACYARYSPTTWRPRRRRAGQRRRRAPVPGHADRRRAVRERARHPGGGAARPRRDPPCRVPAGVLLGAADARGDLGAAPRGAVQRDRAAAARHGRRRARAHPAPRGAGVPAPATRTAGSSLPGLRPPRPLHDVIAHGDGRGAADPAGRHLRRLHASG